MAGKVIVPSEKFTAILLRSQGIPVKLDLKYLCSYISAAIQFDQKASFCSVWWLIQRLNWLKL